ncbi:acyl carrier protein [Nonomuraea lactucae]|uniref:acyl carrier protein n=1 Tax=Nonomuraea lactucae TaxID=2249762 RepID=UPI000DE1B22B|nr:acyl carrier protein [Nonomuraea lactucae]
MDEIQETIKSTLVGDLFVEVTEGEINLDDSLRDIFGLDSLGFAELRVQCEDKFGVQISDQHFTPDHFASIRSLSALVRELKAAGG